MNGIDKLRRDHREVEELFAELEEAERPAARARLRERIAEEVLLHARVEEELLYPAVREELPDLDDDVLTDLEEHRVVESAVWEWLTIDPEDERFMPRAGVIRDLIEQHIEAEEEDLFTALEAAWSERRLEELGEEIIEAEEQLQPVLPDLAIDAVRIQVWEEEVERRPVPSRTALSKAELRRRLAPGG